MLLTDEENASLDRLQREYKRLHQAAAGEARHRKQLGRELQEECERSGRLLKRYIAEKERADAAEERAAKLEQRILRLEGLA